MNLIGNRFRTAGLARTQGLQLCSVGALAVLGGLIIAFTIPGALLVGFGLGAAAAGILRLARLPLIWCVTLGAFVTSASWWYTLTVYPG